MLLVIASVASTNAQAFALSIDPGTNKLMGASDVVFLNNHYDVSFQRGSCFDLFSGCDEKSDFLFGGNLYLAMQASNALQSQVLNQFIPGNGPYDTSPFLVNGDVYGSNTMGILTPYDVSAANHAFGGVMFVNYYQESGDRQMLFAPILLGVDRSEVFAIWSVHSEVPEPSIISLFLFGFLGLICFIKFRFSYFR